MNTTIKDDREFRELCSYFYASKEQVLEVITNTIDGDMIPGNLALLINEVCDYAKDIFYALNNAFRLKYVFNDIALITLVDRLVIWGKANECEECGGEINEFHNCTYCGTFNFEHQQASEEEEAHAAYLEGIR